MNTKKIIVLVILVLLIIGSVFWIVTRDNYSQQVSDPDAEPIDVALGFYEPWLIALQAEDDDPFERELYLDEILSRELSQKILAGKDGEIDPVLCQSEIPTSLTTRNVFSTEEEAEVVVTSGDTSQLNQAVVNLKKLKGGWYLDDIRCTAGEVGEEKEFNFEEVGYLIKSVPEPFDSNYWHIVSEVNGELAYVTPLYFNSESTCSSAGGDSYTCNPDDFSETTKVKVYGSLDESGATVAKLEFLE